MADEGPYLSLAVCAIIPELQLLQKGVAEDACLYLLKQINVLQQWLYVSSWEKTGERQRAFYSDTVNFAARKLLHILCTCKACIKYTAVKATDGVKHGTTSN